MDFVPRPDDRLHAILYDLVMGPTGARVVELDDDTALLRTADLSQAMLLVRNPRDANRGIILRSRILGLRDGRLEILLVEGADDDRNVLWDALPMNTGRGIRLMHLTDRGGLWQLPSSVWPFARRPSSSWPLAAYLATGARGASAPDWDAFRTTLTAAGEEIAKETTAKETTQEGEALATLMASRKPIATWILAGTILGFFALQRALGAVDSSPGLIHMGALYRPCVADAELWRLISCAFLHGGVVHLAFNLVALVVFGRQLERMVGTVRYLLIYAGSTIGGSLVSLALNQGFSVGASGALWGLMAAQFVFAWRSKRLLSRPMQHRVLTVAGKNLALNLVNSFRPGVDWAAHLGGGLVGAVVMLGLLAEMAYSAEPGGSSTPAPTSAWLRPAAVAAGAIMLVGALLGPLLGKPWRLAEPPVFERVSVPEARLTVEVPRGLRTGRVAKQAPGKDQELTFGDIVADGVLLGVRAKPISLRDSDMGQSLDLIKGIVDKMSPPNGYTAAGDTTRRVVEGTTLFERVFDAKHGVKLTHLVRLTQTGMLVLDMVELAGLPSTWQKVGEHALLSIEQGSP